MPGNTRTHVARKRKRALRAAGSVEDARRLLWRAMQAAEGVLNHAATENDALIVLKATHALTQACAAYTRVVEAGEVEARLVELEDLVASGTLRRVA